VVQLFFGKCAGEFPAEILAREFGIFQGIQLRDHRFRDVRLPQTRECERCEDEQFRVAINHRPDGFQEKAAILIGTTLIVGDVDSPHAFVE
jgi:hypothetical protein